MTIHLKVRAVPVFSIVLLLAGCATFRVDSPKPSDPFAATNGWSGWPDSPIVVHVVFNTAVDPSTVTAGRTIFLKTTQDPNAAFNISWAADHKSFTLTTVKMAKDLLSPHPDDGFTLTLIGTDAGQGVVKDTTGAALDGDYSGTAGGDYRMAFSLIG